MLNLKTKTKKIIAIVAAALVLVAIIVVSAVSCSRNSVEGKYELQAIYDDGKVYCVGDTYGETTLSEDYIVVEINADNTLVVILKEENIEIKQEGVWYRTDEYSFACQAGEVSGSFYFDNGTIVFRLGSETLILG